MIPPTSINGTDITGATIDGTDVTEITVDGDVVFSAQQLPVAYSNLIAWYPFDSAEYGGSNADDVTAIIGGSGNDTAFNGSVSGANHVASGGAVDINAGSSSGYYEFPGGSDQITIQDHPDLRGINPLTISFWARLDALNVSDVRGVILKGQRPFGDSNFLEWQVTNSGSNLGFVFHGAAEAIEGLPISFNKLNTSEFFHYSASFNNGSISIYLDGNLETSSTASFSQIQSTSEDVILGGAGNRHFDGDIDDFRIYNKELSQTEIQQIYNNTKPSGKP